MRLKQFHLILIFPSFTSSRPGQFKLVDYTNYKTDLRTVFFKNGPSRPFLFIVGLCKHTIFQYVWCLWVGKLHHFRWWTVGAVNWLCRQAGRQVSRCLWFEVYERHVIVGQIVLGQFGPVLRKPRTRSWGQTGLAASAPSFTFTEPEIEMIKSGKFPSQGSAIYRSRYFVI